MLDDSKPGDSSAAQPSTLTRAWRKINEVSRQLTEVPSPAFAACNRETEIAFSGVRNKAPHEAARNNLSQVPALLDPF